jgi:GH15 family glucan-1,4-alpha-glucosidase
LAEYEIERSRSEQDIKKVLPYFTMIAKCALPSGILPEQVDPITYKPLSVAPLTWSHAQYVYLVLSYMEKLEELGVARMCEMPFINDHY